MQRILEPELMDDIEQARAYAEADFDESNTLFVDLFLQHHPDWSAEGTMLDLGCGPGDIAIRLASQPDEPVSLSLAGVRGLGEAAVLLGLNVR